jgi:hypothetical protein
VKLNLPSNINPMLALFIRLTILVAVALIVLWLAAIVFKVVLVAAIIAAVVLGGLLLYRFISKTWNRVA